VSYCVIFNAGTVFSRGVVGMLWVRFRVWWCVGLSGGVGWDMRGNVVLRFLLYEKKRIIHRPKN